MVNNLIIPPRNKGQHFKPEFIKQLLEEAASSSIHGTAVRHGLRPSQLFEWRKKFKEKTAKEAVEQTASPSV